MKKSFKYMLTLIVFVFCLNTVFGQITNIPTVVTARVIEVTTVQNKTQKMTKSDLIEEVSTDTSSSDDDVSDYMDEDISADDNDTGITAGEPEAIEPDDISTTPSKDTQEHDPGITILEIISIVPSDQQVGFGDGVKGARLPSEQSDPDRPIVTGVNEETGDNTRKTVRDQDIPTPSKKPKIVVVGSKLRDEQEEAIDHKKWIDILSITPETEEELEEYVEATVALDEAIEEVTITDETVTMKYKHPARLFGFINLNYIVSTTVDEQGVEVKYPLWVVFTKNNAKELTAELEEELSSVGDDSQLANIDLQNTLQKQQQILQTMSNIMKTQHDTAMAVIRKIG